MLFNLLDEVRLASCPHHGSSKLMAFVGGGAARASARRQRAGDAAVCVDGAAAGRPGPRARAAGGAAGHQRRCARGLRLRARMLHLLGTE